jgi:hypothetical protein
MNINSTILVPNGYYESSFMPDNSGLNFSFGIENPSIIGIQRLEL